MYGVWSTRLLKRGMPNAFQCAIVVVVVAGFFSSHYSFFFSVSYSYFSYICNIQDYAVASYIHSHTSYYVLAIYTRSHSISVLMWEFNHKKKKVFIRSILFCCCCCCCVFFSFVWCALSVFVPHVYIFAAVLHIYESVSSRNAFR